MLRARFPLAVAVLAATLTIPTTTAFAANESISPNSVQGAVENATGSDSSGGTGSGSTTGTPTPSGGSDTSSAVSGTGSSSGGTGTESGSGDSGSGTGSDSGTTSGGGSSDPLGGLTGGSGGSASDNPLTDGLSQLQDAAGSLQDSGNSGSSPDIAGALQTFGTCLQDAQGSASPAEAGQLCIENLVKAITGDARANCLSENAFTLQFLIDRLQSGQPPSQGDLTKFQSMLTGLLNCLAAAPSQSSAPVESGGGATSEPTISDVAPAATPVSGTPNFTG